jgi:carbamoylphosphate synthase large subunit
MRDESTKKAIEHVEPTKDSIEAMPEIADKRFRRRPGRGHHAAKSVGEVIAIDADLWSHFGSEQAVNQALRRLVEESRGS